VRLTQPQSSSSTLIAVAGVATPLITVNGLYGTPVYLDVEGLPDRDFYYLIGVRVGASHDAVQYSFWAADEKAEKHMWQEFLDVLSATPEPRLIHYGNYETVFLKRMRERHGGPREGSAAATAVERAVNLLSFIFARVYFPTYSNGLKEIAHNLGFRYSASLHLGSNQLSGGVAGRPHARPQRNRRSSITIGKTAKRLNW
jgi:predicted RecB family nuclease